MRSILIAIILTTFIVSACKIFQEHPFHKQKYFRNEEIGIDLKCSNYIKLNKEMESKLNQKVYSTKPGNKELIELFYKLLTILV
ncbi:unnamed protein product [Paramecium sonneborni]|uniref:Lipoprotein n=1 Tax=Paramecium sonneborni TaxID=65129 RepID=A0A8S1PN63_9CILI|nr:unnamed protein product [Paramecium sonneborni]